jgi:hypothetical protein
MRRLFLYLGLGITTCATAFEEKPWLGDFLGFYLDSSYTYSRFNHVQNAVHQLRHASNDNLLTFDLNFCPADGWDIDLEAEFAHTPRQRWGRRSLATQLRYRWLDDIAGDPISLTTGLSIRQVAHVSVRDISSPYAARWDFEVHSAIGKEWSRGPSWYMRWYGVGALGQGNRGSPWTRARLVLEGNREDHHQVSLFGYGYWGFGSQEKVNIAHFHGWGQIDHGSIDLGAGYRYVTDVWGYLWLEYSHRVYARSYPAAVNTVQIGYHLPFTFFN